ncbi:MAG: NUDIX domain-containing protein, partial [Chloroflexota bacterium]
GGGLEDRETPEQAAVRETFEETGYHIDIDCFVGEYYRSQFGTVRYVYRGHVVGGEAIQQGPETLQVDWFLPDDLPSRLAPSVSEIIADALKEDAKPVMREERFPAWKVLAMRILLWLRNFRNRLQGRL